MRVGEISRERQVLDGRPPGHQAKLPDVVVRVTVRKDRGGRGRPEADTSRSAEQSLGRVVVADRGPGTVDAGVPLGVPVVGEGTAHTPGLNELLLEPVCEHSIGSNPESYALVSSSQVCATIDLVCTCRRTQVLNVVARRTVGIHALDVDGVAGASRDVLDRQGQLSSPTPPVIGVAKQFTGAERVRTVIRHMVVMCRERSLEQTPSLIDADHAYEVGGNRSRIIARAEKPARAQVVNASLEVGDLVLRRYRAANAVAEFSSIAELVHARDRAATADETVVVVAGIVGPGSRE